jgi:hypothetical protein
MSTSCICCSVGPCLFILQWSMVGTFVINGYNVLPHSFSFMCKNY